MQAEMLSGLTNAKTHLLYDAEEMHRQAPDHFGADSVNYHVESEGCVFQGCAGLSSPSTLFGTFAGIVGAAVSVKF